MYVCMYVCMYVDCSPQLVPIYTREREIQYCRVKSIFCRCTWPVREICTTEGEEEEISVEIFPWSLMPPVVPSTLNPKY